MPQLRRIALLVLLFAAGNLRAQNVPAVWNAITQPAFDSTKYATVENIEIVRDPIHITLIQGTIQFTQAAGGVVYGAAFEGQGRVQIDPPNASNCECEFVAAVPSS